MDVSVKRGDVFSPICLRLSAPNKAATGQYLLFKTTLATITVPQ
ncbi:hypothetical protein LCAA2362_1747 [Lacticaseibacillus casei A2-362]|nr:hypothetical protein LCAA2362_1747 [Lacticaseibacillus casei A2-362]